MHNQTFKTTISALQIILSDSKLPIIQNYLTLSIFKYFYHPYYMELKFK